MRRKWCSTVWKSVSYKNNLFKIGSLITKFKFNSKLKYNPIFYERQSTTKFVNNSENHNANGNSWFEVNHSASKYIICALGVITMYYVNKIYHTGEMKIKFATWNIDTNISRLEDNPLVSDSFPEWRLAKRIDMITRHIGRIDPDILHLQELRKLENSSGEKIDSVTRISSFLEESGYTVLLSPYNPTGDLAYKYITAYKSDKFALVDQEVLYISRTPETPTDRQNLKLEVIKAHNFGIEFERSIFATKLIHKATQKSIFTLNVHMSPNRLSKIEGSNLIASLVQKYIKKNPDVSIIVAGDFNSFLEEDSIKQFEILTRPRIGDTPLLNDITKDLLLFNNEQIPHHKSTFFFFPYDFGTSTSDFQLKLSDLNKQKGTTLLKEEISQFFFSSCSAKGGHLDHILIYNMQAPATPKLEVSYQFGNGPEDYTEEGIKHYIMSHINTGPAFASDHQMISAILTLGDIGVSHEDDAL